MTETHDLQERVSRQDAVTWSDTALKIEARPRDVSANFEPKSPFAIDESFPYSPFWENFVARHPDDVYALYIEKYGKIVWDENECHEVPVVRNGVKSSIVSPSMIILPASIEPGYEQPKIQGRISPRTMHFFVQFGYLRQVKPMCGNAACVNPYHQMTERTLERPQAMKIATNSGRPLEIPAFAHDFTVAEAFTMVHEAGFGGADWGKVKLIDFINMVVSHKNYRDALGRGELTYKISIEAKVEVL